MTVYHFIHHAWHFFLIDETDIPNYADESTPYTMWHTPYIMIKPEKAGKKLFKWFSDNGMKAYSKKCDFLLSLAANTHICLDEFQIENCFSQKPLGVTINKKSDYIEHASNLCDKASEKINALARIFPFDTT